MTRIPSSTRRSFEDGSIGEGWQGLSSHNTEKGKIGLQYSKMLPESPLKRRWEGGKDIKKVRNILKCNKKTENITFQAGEGWKNESGKRSAIRGERKNEMAQRRFINDRRGRDRRGLNRRFGANA